jgi:hypothetical protein
MAVLILQIWGAGYTQSVAAASQTPLSGGVVGAGRGWINRGDSETGVHRAARPFRGAF